MREKKIRIIRLSLSLWLLSAGPFVLYPVCCLIAVFGGPYPVSILHKSKAGCYRPVRVADGPITARYRFM